MVKIAKRELSSEEVDFIRETLKAAGSEFDELFRSKEWFVTSVSEDIEEAIGILEDKDVETNSSDSGHPDKCWSTD